MRNRIITVSVLALAALALCSCNCAKHECKNEGKHECNHECQNAIAIVEDVPTIQAFTKDAIPEADIQRILNAGVNAPSAMNMQPWHFTVLTNAETIANLASAQRPPMGGPGMPPPPGAGPQGMPPMGGDRPLPPPPSGNGPKSGLGDTPVVILISCRPGSEFDAGLACESMNDMANVLGYGTKIVSSITMLFRGENKTELYKQFQVPDGQEIVAAILLGKINTENYDAVSTASPRNDFDKVVTLLK